MKSFQADYVYPINAEPIKNGIVTVNDLGEIISVSETPPEDIHLQKLSGIIVPGFINTHCHLELSHLAGKIRTGAGLISFIKDVQTFRNADSAMMLAAAKEADHQMYENGIIAVADTANSNITFDIKAKSELYYHTFVEIFGFTPYSAQTLFDRSVALMEQFKPQSASVTAHAPYSVSKELFKLIKRYCDTNDNNLLSIHNQECEDENKFYRYKLGGFIDLYQHLGINIEHFKPQARNSLQSIIPLLTSRQKILLVHNTCTNLKDIYFIKRFDRKINWCFCPNANIYIEKHVPKIELFLNQGFNITLGTDSLASNNKLCILSEMKTLQQNVPSLKLDTLLQWGTLNGAKVLGIDHKKGSITPGKTPGLNLLTDLDELKLTPETKVKKLV